MIRDGRCIQLASIFVCCMFRTCLRTVFSLVIIWRKPLEYTKKKNCKAPTGLFFQKFVVEYCLENDNIKLSQKYFHKEVVISFRERVGIASTSEKN